MGAVISLNELRRLAKRVYEVGHRPTVIESGPSGFKTVAVFSDFELENMVCVKGYDRATVRRMVKAALEAALPKGRKTSK